MTVIIRILAVIFAYVVACLGAAIVLTMGTLMPQWNDLASSEPQTFVLWSVVAVATAMIAGTAMLPTLLVVGLTEAFAWRSSLVYAALGGVIALALSYGADFAGYLGEAGGGLAHQREVLAAAGIAGGLVYWLFAGRNAGVWKQGSRT
jgi:hypothetical protein